MGTHVEVEVVTKSSISDEKLEELIFTKVIDSLALYAVICVM